MAAIASLSRTTSAADPATSGQAATKNYVDTTAQPVDSDLTAIGALTPAANDVIQYKSSAWTNRTPAQLKADLAIAQADVSGLVAALAALQPLDSDLTTIAGLTATTDSVMQAKAGAWAARTLAQLRTDLALQPLDSDLTTIAALTATTDSFMQAKAGAWAARTIAQVKTDLGVTALENGYSVTDAQDTAGNTTSGTYTATLDSGAVACGFSFTAPPSGKVVFHHNCQVAATSGFSFASIRVGTGATVGAGTVVLAAVDKNAIISPSNGLMRAGVSTPLFGLTPGSTYNVQEMFVGGGIGTFSRKDLTVVTA